MEHVERNMEAISKAGKLANVTLMSIPGDHASPVIRSKASQDAFGKNRGKKLEKKFISLLKAYNKTYNQLIELENKAKGAASQVEKSAIKKTTEKLTEINLKLNSIENSMKKINELNEAVGQTQIDRFLKKANLGHSLLEN